MIDDWFGILVDSSVVMSMHTMMTCIFYRYSSRHRDAVHRLLRVFIHATDHPIVTFGLADILVLYDLYLRETPSKANLGRHGHGDDATGDVSGDVDSCGGVGGGGGGGGEEPRERVPGGGFDRKFWAYKHPSDGNLLETDMYQEHLMGGPKITLRQLDPPEVCKH